MDPVAEPAIVLKQALDRIRHQISSNLVNQKRPATLLVAIETTLNEQGTALAPVAYFAALLSTISQLAVSADGVDADGETLPAALYLFAIVLPCTQGSIIKSKSSDLLQVFGPLLVTYNDQAAAMKSLLTIMQFIYLNMDNSTITSSLQAKQVFNSVLALLLDQRPKVRRKAQEVIQVLLANPPAPSIRHPYATRVADFVLESLKDALKEGKKGGKKRMQEDASGANAEASRAIGLCAFVKMAGKEWPSNHIAPLCSLLLSLPRLSNSFLTTASYDILETLFSKSSDSFEEGKVEETLEAVLAAKPAGTGSVDERVLPGWLGTVEHGFVAFSKSNPEHCTSAVFSTFNGVLGYLSSSAPSVRVAATSTLAALLRYCITNEEVVFAAKASQSSNAQTHPLPAISETLLSAIRNIKNQAVAMPHLLAVISSFIARLRYRVQGDELWLVPAAKLLAVEHVRVVGHLRSLAHFEYREAADSVLGTATEVCGPEWTLSILPLNLDDSEKSDPSEPGRAWLLPLFKSKITNTKLSHFTTYFVPLSERMFGRLREAEAKVEAAQTEGDKKRLGIQAKVYEALVQQIWALFPGYCDLPVDLAEAFTKQFCEILSNVLYSQNRLRPAIFRGLQLLVERNKGVMSSASPSEVLIQSFGVDATLGKKNIDYLSKLAPNLLAVMFNVFSKAGKEGRGYVLDGISAYLSILSAKDLVGTFNKLKTMLLQALSSGAKPTPGEATVPQTMLDFLVQLVPYLPDRSTGDALLKSVTGEAVLQNKDSAVQKKAYRALVRMCESEGSIGEQCIRANLEQLVEELVEKNSSVAAAAKKDRIVLLATIVPVMPKDKLHIIPSIIPEAVLSTKEANEATRTAAYDLLVGMAEKMAKGGVIKRSLVQGAADMDEDADEDASPVEDAAEANLQEYVTMVAAGLVGTTPHMISATITALSRLLFEYHEQLPSSVINDLLSTMLVFLGSANREIVKSAIGFVKVAVVCLPPVDIQPHLDELVPALFNWSHEHANHFKMNIRHILERMLRKFGYEDIEKLTPEKDRKLLVNIRKRHQRSKRKREQAEQEEAASGDEKAQPRTTRNAYEDALYGSEDEDEDSEAEAVPQKAAPNGKQRQQQPQQGLRKNAIGRRRDDPKDLSEAYINEGSDPLDLLDERMLGRISRKDPRVEEARRTKREEGSSRFKTDQSGKLIFNDSDDGGLGSDQGEGESTNAYLEAINGEDGFRRGEHGRIKFNKSTKRGRAQMEEDELVEDVKDRLEGLGMLKDKTKKQKKAKENIGQEFRAKKAGGDVKKDGVSPYAYVPLGNGKKRSNLNITGKGKRR